MTYNALIKTQCMNHHLTSGTTQAQKTAFPSISKNQTNIIDQYQQEVSKPIKSQ